MGGDINAFQQLYAGFHRQLKGYLYRLLTDREDVEDIAHDTFIKAFERIGQYKGESSFRTWVFSIATNLAYDVLKRRKRWQPDIKAQGKALCMSDERVYNRIMTVAQASGEGAFQITDHINHCFTCMSKTLLIEQQVAVLLKDVLDFSVKEIALILQKSNDVTKHLLQDGRQTMMVIFDHRCTLINKKGVCNQCSELNGMLNPKQDKQAAINKVKLVRQSSKYDREKLYDLRAKLVATVDPMNSDGADLQDILMQCDRLAIGEIQSI